MKKWWILEDVSMYKIHDFLKSWLNQKNDYKAGTFIPHPVFSMT